MKTKTKMLLCLAVLSLCFSNAYSKGKKETTQKSETHLSVVLYDNEGIPHEVYSEEDDENLEFKVLFEKNIKKSRRILLEGFLPKEIVDYGNFCVYIKDDDGNILATYFAISPEYTTQNETAKCFKYNFHKDFYNYLGHVNLKGRDLKKDADFPPFKSIENFYTCYGYTMLVQSIEDSEQTKPLNIADIIKEHSTESKPQKDFYHRIGYTLLEGYRLGELSRFLGRDTTMDDFYACYGYVKFLEYTKQMEKQETSSTSK